MTPYYSHTWPSTIGLFAFLLGPFAALLVLLPSFLPHRFLRLKGKTDDLRKLTRRTCSSLLFFLLHQLRHEGAHRLLPLFESAQLFFSSFFPRSRMMLFLPHFRVHLRKQSYLHQFLSTGPTITSEHGQVP
jgi:hypothetical protein